MNILLYARCHERDLVRGIIHRCLKVSFFFFGGWGCEDMEGGCGGYWETTLQGFLGRKPTGEEGTRRYDGAFSAFIFVRDMLLSNKGEQNGWRAGWWSEWSRVGGGGGGRLEVCLSLRVTCS